MDNFISSHALAASASDMWKDIITRQRRLPQQVRGTLDLEIEVLSKLMKTIRKLLDTQCMARQLGLPGQVRDIKTRTYEAMHLMTKIERKLKDTERDVADMEAGDSLKAQRTRTPAPSPRPSSRACMAQPRAESWGDLNRYSPLAPHSHN